MAMTFLWIEQDETYSFMRCVREKIHGARSKLLCLTVPDELGGLIDQWWSASVYEDHVLAGILHDWLRDHPEVLRDLDSQCGTRLRRAHLRRAVRFLVVEHEQGHAAACGSVLCDLDWAYTFEGVLSAVAKPKARKGRVDRKGANP